MAQEVIKPKKSFVVTASGWFSLLGVFAATTALVLVPVSVDTDAVLSNPNVAYYRAELRAFLVVSAALLVAVTGMLAFNRRPLRFPMLLPVLTLLGASALSTLFSDRPAYSLYGDRGQGLLSVAAGVLLFYALAQGLTSYARLRFLLAAATTAAALVSMYGIAENYGFELLSGWGNPPFTDLGRSSATIGSSLTLSAYLTLMMGAATALWMGATTRLGRLAWLVVLALMGACWIYAEARGAILAGGLALPLILIAVKSKMGMMRPMLVPVAVLVLAMSAAVAVSGALGFSTLSVRTSASLLAYLALVGIFALLLERGKILLALLLPVIVLACAAAFLVAAPGGLTLSNLGVSRAASGGGGDISLQTRLYIWRDTVPMILDRPLLGHGPDNYLEPLRPYISEDLKGVVGEREVDRAHNHLLQVSATTGLFGLVAYLWILVSFFRNAYKRSGWLLSALSSAILAYEIQLQTAFSSVATDVAFWGILGASVALMRLRDGEGSEPLEGTNPVGSHRSRRRRSRSGGRAEIVAATIVAGVLLSMFVPIFLQQREKAGDLTRAKLNLNLLQAVDTYSRIERYSGTYPKSSVYTRENPIRNASGKPAFRPPENVIITTEIMPEGEFVMRARKTTLAGTFSWSYDSAGDGRSIPISRND